MLIWYNYKPDFSVLMRAARENLHIYCPKHRPPYLSWPRSYLPVSRQLTAEEQVESNCVHFSISISISFTILPRVVSAYAKDVDVPFATEVPLSRVYSPGVWWQLYNNRNVITKTVRSIKNMYVGLSTFVISIPFISWQYLYTHAILFRSSHNSYRWWRPIVGRKQAVIYM